MARASLRMYSSVKLAIGGMTLRAKTYSQEITSGKTWLTSLVFWSLISLVQSGSLMGGTIWTSENMPPSIRFICEIWELDPVVYPKSRDICLEQT
jgi:hypothetical protein